jgi:putative transposase
VRRCYGERTEERVNQRNGYRQRRRDTRVGIIEELAVPKLRRGAYSPEFLLTPSRRAERTLVDVGLPGLCRGRVHATGRRPGEGDGINRISKSEVSRIAVELDKVVAEF